MDIEKPAILPGTLRSLAPLSAKVAAVHGDHDPRLREIHAGFVELCETLEEDGEGSGGRPEVEAAFRKIRELSDGYAPPEWACTSYRRLLSELRRLEDDVLRQAG